MTHNYFLTIFKYVTQHAGVEQHFCVRAIPFVIHTGAEGKLSSHFFPTKPPHTYLFLPLAPPHTFSFLVSPHPPLRISNGIALRLRQIESVFPVKGWLGFRQIFEEKNKIR